MGNYDIDCSTIYHHVKGIVTFSHWIRILPITKVQVTNTRTVSEQDGPKNENSEYNKYAETENNLEYFSIFRYNNLHFVFNLGIHGIVATLGCFCLAFQFNLTNNATQNVGFLSYVLTTLILQLAIVFFCNYNTPKVGYKKSLSITIII